MNQNPHNSRTDKYIWNHWCARSRYRSFLDTDFPIAVGYEFINLLYTALVSSTVIVCARHVIFHLKNKQLMQGQLTHEEIQGYPFLFFIFRPRGCVVRVWILAKRFYSSIFLRLCRGGCIA